MKKYSIWMSIVILVVLLLSSCAAPATAPADPPVPSEPVPSEAVPTETESAPASGSELILATTTSTEDSGLLDYLLPYFEADYGVKVNVIAVGTGQAITLGEDGNADVLLVHARSREDVFMEAGHGVRREDVMYNDFVIVGPESDPAGIQGMRNAVEAFKQLSTSEAAFISRGDESGTHTKELGIWKKAEIEPAGDWYISAGQGMGEVLTMANEQQAYTLSDRATYLARSKAGLDLVIVFEGDRDLFNPYGVIAVNPDKGAHIKAELANQFIDWIVSLPVQEKIAQFGMDDFGQSLFIPDSTAWREAHGTAAEPTEEPAADVALKITGLVENEMAWSEAEVKAMQTMTVEATNKQGEKSEYTGVDINALLALAGPSAEATTIVYLAGDGFTGEVSLAEVQGCTDCIVSFRNQGGFSIVMPNFASNLQVKDVIEIQVK